MGQSIQSDIYDYAIFFDNVGPGDPAVTKPLQIQSDADFEVQSLQAGVILAPGATPGDLDGLVANRYPGLFINIVNTGNGQKWSNIPVVTANLFGTGQNPFFLSVTQVMERNASYDITLENKIKQPGFPAIYRIYFVFSGRKLLP